MSADTQPFFIVSSGRSGTAMLHKALSAAGDIEMHHEYLVNQIQPLAVRRYMGLIGQDETREILRQTYGAAVHYAHAAHWGDSSNKASWLIRDLAALLPNAKFVHLVRDGRKVAGSYFRKLGDECYDDRSTAILQAFYDAPDKNAAPPPEKKYWWPLPPADDPFAVAFRKLDQFSRIAWHWAEINRQIADALAPLPAHRKHFVKLEDLQTSPQAVKTLFGFLNLDTDDETAALFARPHNVNRPVDERLTPDQARRFDAMSGMMMQTLGYAGTTEYVVKY